MIQRHIFLSILLTLSCSASSAMDHRWQNDPHAQKKINVVRALDNIFSYIYEHNLTLANANSELQKKSAYFQKHYSLTYDKIIAAPIKPTLKQDYVDEYTLRFKIASLKQGIFICIKLPEDLQKVMLSHLGFDSKPVQDDFLARPLAQAFEWLAECRNQPFTQLPARYKLNFKQYRCLKNMNEESGQKLKDADAYVDADSHESFTENFVFVSPSQKKILLSLPQEFTGDSQAQEFLHKIKIAEKPSTATKLCIPLSMVLHSVRCGKSTNNVRNVSTTRAGVHFFCAMSSFFISLIERNYIPRKLFYSLALCFYSYGLSGVIKNLIAINIDYKLFISDAHDTCIVKHSPVSIRDIPFITLTTANILLQKYLLNIPLNTIFSGIALNLAPFVAYDCWKYGIKYGIKTQSIARLIEDHKNTKRSAFCTLL